jgi:hypothetical protein
MAMYVCTDVLRAPQHVGPMRETWFREEAYASLAVDVHKATAGGSWGRFLQLARMGANVAQSSTNRSILNSPRFYD